MGKNENLKIKDPSYDIDYDRAIAIAKQEIPSLKIGGLNPPDDHGDHIYLRGHSHVPPS